MASSLSKEWLRWVAVCERWRTISTGPINVFGRKSCPAKSIKGSGRCKGISRHAYAWCGLLCCSTGPAWHRIATHRMLRFAPVHFLHFSCPVLASSQQNGLVLATRLPENSTPDIGGKLTSRNTKSVSHSLIFTDKEGRKDSWIRR